MCVRVRVYASAADTLPPGGRAVTRCTPVCADIRECTPRRAVRLYYTYSAPLSWPYRKEKREREREAEEAADTRRGGADGDAVPTVNRTRAGRRRTQGTRPGHVPRRGLVNGVVRAKTRPTEIRTSLRDLDRA